MKKTFGDGKQLGQHTPAACSHLIARFGPAKAYTFA